MLPKPNLERFGCSKLTQLRILQASSRFISALLPPFPVCTLAEVGAAWQNGFAERLVRTIKEEEVDLSEYRDYQDAYRQVGRFLDQVYMHKRIHSSLGYLTPAEFESQWCAQHTTINQEVSKDHADK